MKELIVRLTTSLAHRYRVTRELGVGGMATVYLAHDLKHERDVAIKVLHPDLGAALGAERFLSEIKTTAKLQHPHILPLLDSGAADGLLYYVMPYVRGETLRARLERERQLPIADALRIASEVANALEHAHKQGIIHRDIKPENILLQDGAAVVADFGIALAVQSAGGARMTQTGLSLGTPQYMSPEQAMGERTIDARSDIYALGAVTYEMLVGEPPFTGASVQAIVAKVMNAELERPTLTRKSVPLGTEAAVLRALAKLPVDRYASAAAFAEALTAGERVSFERSVATDQRAVPPRRWPWLIAAAGAGAALTFALMSARPNGQDSTTVLSSAQMTFSGQTAIPALSADGDVLAFVRGSCDQQGLTPFMSGVGAESETGDVRCRTSLMVQDSGSTTPVTVLSNVSVITAVRWSADNASLFIAARLDSLREGLFQVPRLGGAPRVVAPLGPFDVHPAGDSLIMVPSTRGIATAPYARIVAVRTGVIADSVRMPAASVASLAWSPNGQRLAVGSLNRMFLMSRDGAVLDSMDMLQRSTVRWNIGGTALLVFRVGSGREDELVSVAVTRDGHFSGTPTVVLSRMQTLYRGEFDVARRTGRVALTTGDATTDLWSFAIGSGASTNARQATRGTTWYGTPSIAPDGRTAYFMRGDAVGDNMYSVSLDRPGADEQALSESPGIVLFNAAPLSADGTRFMFSKQAEGASVLEGYDVNVPKRVVRKLSGYQPMIAVPLGRSGLVDTRRNGDSLVVLADSSARPHYIVLPSGSRVVGLAISPDEREAAVMVVAGTRSMLGILSLAGGWNLRVLADFNGDVGISSLSWTTTGAVYFARLPEGGGIPILYRVPSAGGAVTPVMPLPPTCWIQTVAVARAAPVGICQTQDIRSDVYLRNVPGVTR